MLKYSHEMEEKYVIIYDKLGEYLESKKMKYIDLQKQLNLSPSITAKFTKNRPISTETLNKVCEYLKVQPGEIMEWIPDSEYEKQNAEKLAIQAQIDALQAKLKEL